MRNNYKIINNYVEIYIKSKKHNIYPITYIDLDDLEKILQYDVMWFPDWQEDIRNYYAEATQYLGIIDGKPKYKHLTLSRIIMDCYDNNKVDHKNHNTLDNRKYNLRIIANADNIKNRKTKNKNNKTGIRNVCEVKGKFRIQLQDNGKNKTICEYDTLEEAKSKVEELRKKYYGDYAGEG